MRLVRETRLTASDLIWPVFIVEGTSIEEPIHAMPGVFRLSIDRAVEAGRKAEALGIPAIALFPCLSGALKDERGSYALDPDGLACRAARAFKKALPGLGVIGDIALDPYTTHGHDGIVRDGDVANDETVAVLARMAVVHASAGFDVLAPSDMMDGRIGAIRDALDDANLDRTALLAYAAKYASSYYGPFREAVGSTTRPGGVDKRSYQMDPGNGREALREVELDIAEGADVVMVKPALPYLDVIARIKSRFGVPTFAYQVSGEYAMLRAAADRGWLPWKESICESLLGIKRAGADAILTYAALEVAGWLR